jgi:hypothetical protein
MTRSGLRVFLIRGLEARVSLGVLARILRCARASLCGQGTCKPSQLRRGG